MRQGWCALLLVALCQESIASSVISPFPDIYGDDSWNDEPSLKDSPRKPSPAAPSFHVTSSGISSEGILLAAHGCQASCTRPQPENCQQVTSPQLEWRDPPEGTQSLAFLMDSKSSYPSNRVHWLVTDMPPGKLSVEAGANLEDHLLHSAREWLNSWHQLGFHAPCGDTPVQQYRLVVFALKQQQVDLKEFFEENPTALGNEIQHELIHNHNVLDAVQLTFSWPNV